MRMPQGAEWLIILVLILLLFGAKRLPDAARGIGRSLRILKSETKGLHDDDPPAEVTNRPATQALPEVTTPPPPVVETADPATPPSSSST